MSQCETTRARVDACVCSTHVSGGGGDVGVCERDGVRGGQRRRVGRRQRHRHVQLLRDRLHRRRHDLHTAIRTLARASRVTCHVTRDSDRSDVHRPACVRHSARLLART